MSWWGWLIVVFLVLWAFGSISDAVKKAEEEREAKRRQKEAEDYIMNSGDQEAIKALMMARANPVAFNQMVASGGSRGNDTLKTVLGVTAGVAAGNLVANAITADAVSKAVESASHDVANEAGSSLLGGLLDE